MGNEGDLPESRSECGNVTAIQRPVDPGYVIRTNSLKGRMKTFINVCQSEAITEPSFTNQDCNQDVLWNVPHGLGGARDEHAKRGDRFKVFDFIIHPNTLRLTETNAALKKVMDELAVEGVMKHFNVRLDRKGLTFPEMTYKGTANSVGYVEKVTTVAIDGETNGLKQLYSNQCYGMNMDRNGSNCQANVPCAKENECAKNENKWIDDSSGKHIHDKCDGTVVSMANGDIAVKEVDNSSVFTDERVADILPDYKSQQDETTMTFIFAVERVKNENVIFSVVSPQEICLKMKTDSEKGFPLRYTCCLKFSSKYCRLMENGCHVDVSDVNVVLTLAKAEKSWKKWNTYFVGTSPQHLEVRDFVTVDNLKGELDSLDLNGNSAENDHQKTTESVNVASVTDEKLVLEIKKAEEKEMDDVPGEIIVIHEKGIPRLHGILKQRSMSESSDDYSMWSNSTDRHTSTATGSETESDEEEFSQGLFRPQFKKSVSFNEHIDQTMYATNQSVSQMHALLKNKRRRIRKREQKHDIKESRRRHRSNSESYSQDEREFDCRPLEERILASMIKMKNHVDKSEDEHASANSTGAECNGRIAVVSGNKDAVETNKDEGKMDEEKLISGDVEGTCGNNLDPTGTADEEKLISGEVEATCGSNLDLTGTADEGKMIYGDVEGTCGNNLDLTGMADEEKMISGDVEGTSGSNLDLIRAITSLETCGETTNGEGYLSGNDLITEVDRGFRDIKCPIVTESYLYTPVERTSGCGDFAGLELPLKREESSTGVRTFNSSDGSILKKKSNDEVLINTDLFKGQFASSFSVGCQKEKVKYYSVLENGKDSDSDDLEEEEEEEEEDGVDTLSMSL